jgi:hypothetical protein
VSFLAAPSTVGAQELTLVFRDGRAKLSATNVPASRILAEWARVGRTRIVNADRLVGPALTLELEWVPERVALDTILRSAGGYMAAPRPGDVAGASVFDRILVMPASTQMAARPMPAPPPPRFVAPPQPPAELAPETMSFDAPPPDAPEAETYVPPEEVLNPGATGPGEIAQPFTPGGDGDPLVPTPYPGGISGPPGSNPWNVTGGSATPGVISPPAEPAQEPNNPQPPPLQP